MNRAGKILLAAILPGGLIVLAVWFFFFRTSPFAGIKAPATAGGFASGGGGAALSASASGKRPTASGGGGGGGAGASGGAKANAGLDLNSLLSSALSGVKSLFTSSPETDGAKALDNFAIANASPAENLSVDNAFNQFGELGSPSAFAGTISLDNGFAGIDSANSYGLNSSLWSDGSTASAVAAPVDASADYAPILDNSSDALPDYSFDSTPDFSGDVSAVSTDDFSGVQIAPPADTSGDLSLD